MFQLSELFSSAGNHAERKRLLTHTLILERGRGGGSGVARILWLLSDINRLMGLPKEGIRLAKEALDVYRRLNDPVEQTQCPIVLARLLCGDKRFDAAGRAMSCAMALIPGLGKPNKFLACRSHRVLGYISIQGQDKGSYSPLRGGLRNCVLLQLAQPIVLDSPSLNSLTLCLI